MNTQIVKAALGQCPSSDSPPSTAKCLSGYARLGSSVNFRGPAPRLLRAASL